MSSCSHTSQRKWGPILSQYWLFANHRQKHFKHENLSCLRNAVPDLLEFHQAYWGMCDFSFHFLQTAYLVILYRLGTSHNKLQSPAPDFSQCAAVLAPMKHSKGKKEEKKNQATGWGWSDFWSRPRCTNRGLLTWAARRCLTFVVCWCRPTRIRTNLKVWPSATFGALVQLNCQINCIVHVTFLNLMKTTSIVLEHFQLFESCQNNIWLSQSPPIYIDMYIYMVHAQYAHAHTHTCVYIHILYTYIHTYIYIYIFKNHTHLICIYIVCVWVIHVYMYVCM